MTLSFTVNGTPFGKERPRLGRGGRTYTPEKTRDKEREIVFAYREFCGAQRILKGTPISVLIYAYYKPPKGTTKAMREKMLAGEVRPTKKPDWDNIGKLVCDALNGIAYDDDKSIVDATVRKFYSDEPRMVIILQEAN